MGCVCLEKKSQVINEEGRVRSGSFYLEATDTSMTVGIKSQHWGVGQRLGSLRPNFRLVWARPGFKGLLRARDVALWWSACLKCRTPGLAPQHQIGVMSHVCNPST